MSDQPYMEDHFLTPGIDKTANEDPNEQLINLDPYARPQPTETDFSPVSPATQTFGADIPMDVAVVQAAPIVTSQPYMAPEDDVLNETTGVSEPIPYQAPIPQAAAPVMPVSAELLDANEREHFSTRWNEIQGKFVDEPRDAVQQADVLVSDVIEKITQVFAAEHSSLESQWNQGSDVNTEDLRKVLQRYRAFFHRLVD